MKQFLFTVYHPDVEPPPAVELAVIMREVEAFNEELRAAGAWVFAGGLQPPGTATVVRAVQGEVRTAEGPFLRVDQPAGGCWIIKAPNLDAAVAWARRATVACRLPIEVRPFQDESED
ncbi:MAG: YciI family protein [Candidatus Dormibacteria bacterium]|jgi:hypothetical protein